MSSVAHDTAAAADDTAAAPRWRDRKRYAWLLGLIVPLLAFLNVNTSWETAITGGILIGAMALRWAVKRVR